ncbi:MAG: DUF4011 domain-containing protein [Bacteroidetes bacterium]|nr:DUF4011 domain-containing protein [Bacteroidota bacterium]
MADQDFLDFVKARAENIKPKLLDLSRRNPLISTSLSGRSNAYIRVVDELPDMLFYNLTNAQEMRIVPLPDLNEDPKDEDTKKFRDAVSNAQITDDQYLAALEAVDRDADDYLDRVRTIERQLKDRIRDSFGMPQRAEKRDTNLSQHAKNNGITPSYELPELDENERKAKHVDHDIQTLLLPKDLERKLNNISSKCKTWIQETGINVLHVGFGFLEWSEPNQTATSFAPIILFSAKLEKQRTRDGIEFKLSGLGEDAELNSVLAEKLRLEFQIEIPPFKGGSIEDYFAELAEVAPKQITWRVRRQIAIGVFPSARMAMYHDIDTSHPQFTENEIIQTLLGGSSGDAASPFADEYNVDEPEIEERVPCLVLDSDSSQFSTLVDIAYGKNLAVEGPPGTGKSQTIVNAIAAAIAGGKKVLFVAEKLAALNVVKSRLEAAGLGEFILPLQAERSTREQVIASLKARVEMRTPRASKDYEAQLHEFRQVRTELANYILLLTTKFGKTDFTVHEVLTKNIAAAPALASLSTELRDGTTIAPKFCTRSGISELQKLGREIAKAAKDVEGALPFWQGTRLVDANVFSVEEACKLAKQAAEHFDHWNKVNQEFQASGLGLSYDQQQLIAINDTLGELKRSGINLRSELPRKLLDENTRNAVRQFLGKQTTAEQLTSELNEDFRVSLDANLLRDLRRIDELCQASSYEKLDLPEIRSKLSKRRDSIRAAKSLLDKLKQLAEYDPTASQWLIEDLRAAQALVSNIGAEVLVRRTPHNVGTAEASALREVCSEGRWLQDAKLRLGTRITLELRSPSDAIIEALEVFKTAGFFGFISAKNRRAVRFTKSILKAPYKDKSDTVALLEDLLAFRRREEQFENNPNARHLMGAFFRGVESDFEPFEQLAGFLSQVHRDFGGPQAKQLKSFLLTRDDSELAYLPSIPPNLKVQTPATLDKYIFEAEQKVIRDNTALEELDALCVCFTRTHDIRISEIGNIARKLEALVETKTSLEANSVATRLISDSLADGQATIPSINAVLVWAEAADPISELLVRVLEYPDPDQILTLVHECLSTIGHATEALASLCSKTKMDAGLLTNGRTIGEISAHLKLASEDSEGLAKHSLLVAVLQKADEIGGHQLVKHSLAHSEESLLPDRLSAIALRSVAKVLFEKHGSSLAKFHGRHLDDLRTQLAALDRNLILLGRLQIRAKVYSDARPPRGIGLGKKSEWTQMALIENEISKQKRFISLRDLTERSGRALLELKPCWMMSPLAVAQYVPKDSITFDLCIIDEASQMRPEAALGALMRAKQIVVVGDTNQLPPSNFFKKLIDDEDADEDDNVLDESILEMANGAFRPSRRLRWHYRSRHSGLIKFSNRTVYDDNLIVFPSSSENLAHMGVDYRYVGGMYKSGTNAIEARAVVDAALKAMQDDPNRSLGIVTLNQKQRELIFLEFEDALSRDPLAAAYVDKWRTHNEGLEEFFIKNLENVQGDERDVIFISTVYGPESQGGKVAHRFGPINGLAGKRRLNVLFSRAKQKIITFSSMKSGDIVAEEGGNAGVYMLKRWLEYSATGMLEGGVQTNKEPDSDFEVFVMNQIIAMGYEPVPQVGVAGYFIDIGVRHPDWKHGFVLAVECDGASYHSSKSARDRDRLRQEVLEGLGWKFHRIWSTDWFSNPGREANRLRDVLTARMDDLRTRESEFRSAAPQETSPPKPSENSAEDLRSSDGGSEPDLLTWLPRTKSESVGVEIGDTIRVRYIDGDQSTVVITITRERGEVGSGLINKDAPLARALIDAEEGDEVEVLSGAYMRRALIEKVTKPEMAN